MANFQSLEEAKAFFQQDRFATGNGMQLDELTEEKAVCSMTVEENHRNGLGGVMGGAIFTLADFASAVLSNHLHRPTVAQQVSISYLNGVRGKRLTAAAVCLKNGRNNIVTRVTVEDDTGRKIAETVVTSFKLDEKKPGRAGEGKES